MSLWTSSSVCRRSSGPALAQHVVDLRAHFRQGRAHLMRRVGDEALPACQEPADARRVLVHGLDQRPHFRLDARRIDGAQVRGRARQQAVAKSLERPESPHQAEPDEHTRRDDEAALPRDPLDQDLLREGVAGLAGLGDDDDHRGCQAGAVQLLVQGHQVDAFAEIVRGVGRPFLLGRQRLLGQRQVLVPGQRLALGTDDAIEDPLLDVRLEELKRGVGQVDEELAVAHVDGVGDRFGRREQEPVERLVGRRDGGPIAEPGVGDEKSDERDQQPAKELPPQAVSRLRGHSRGHAA